MGLKDTDAAYGGPTRFLHWSLLALIVLQFLLAMLLVFLPEKSSYKAITFLFHESFGLLIFVLGAVFILWRLANPKPTLGDLPKWQRGLARVVHGVIYVAVIAQPVFGVTLVMLHGHDIAFFGWPLIPQLLPESKGAGHVFGTLHGLTGWWILLVALGIHLLASLYHHYVRKDNVLRRMTGGKRNP